LYSIQTSKYLSQIVGLLFDYQHLEITLDTATHVSLIPDTLIKISILFSDKCLIRFKSFSVHSTSSNSPDFPPDAEVAVVEVEVDGEGVRGRMYVAHTRSTISRTSGD
jgi:hypothetical protein